MYAAKSHSVASLLQNTVPVVAGLAANELVFLPRRIYNLAVEMMTMIPMRRRTPAAQWPRRSRMGA